MPVAGAICASLCTAPAVLAQVAALRSFEDPALFEGAPSATAFRTATTLVGSHPDSNWLESFVPTRGNGFRVVYLDGSQSHSLLRNAVLLPDRVAEWSEPLLEVTPAGPIFSATSFAVAFTAGGPRYPETRRILQSCVRQGQTFACRKLVQHPTHSNLHERSSFVLSWREDLGAFVTLEQRSAYGGRYRLKAVHACADPHC